MCVEIMLYKRFIRPALFRIDPERIHDMALKTGSFAGRVPPVRGLVGSFLRYENPRLETRLLGINFRNPMGLAAGFDKNAHLTDIVYDLGFGFEEVGSVTGAPCEGNPKPRLFRLPKDKSIVVNYGLCNEGSERIFQKLKEKKFRVPVGVSIAKANDPELGKEEGIQDYVKAFNMLHGIGSYTTINISCPNVSDGRTFCHPGNLKDLLKEIGRCDIKKPIFLKLMPDAGLEEMGETLSVIRRFDFVSGLVISNLTKKREFLKSSKREIEDAGPGGISGVPVREKSNRLIRYAYKKTKGKYVIIGCGGIFTAEDAYEKIKLGSSLLQMITGMIYEGPGVIRKINMGLAGLLERDGFKNVSEAVGSGL
jgi:dihydroorotate dehydrogenase subfamily 2